MTILHVKSNTIADFTGTITGFDSRGSSLTIAATDLVRPSDWNSGHNQLFTLTGNTIQESTVSGANVQFAASGGVSVGGSAGSIMISAPVAKTYAGFYPCGHQQEWNSGQWGIGTLAIMPMPAAPDFACDAVVLPVQISNASNSSNSFSLSLSYGIYTKNGASLSRLVSGSTSYNGSGSGTVGSYSLWGGVRNVSIGLTSTFPANDYWYAVCSSSATGGGAGQTLNNIVAYQVASSYSGELGVASNTSKQMHLGRGILSVTTNTPPPSIAFTDIRGNSSLFQRAPYLFFRSDTA